MEYMNLENLTILKAHKGLKEKVFSSEELTRFYLEKIKKENKKLNAFINVFFDKAIEQARKRDKTIFSQGPKTLLDGIPFAIKDNILIEDLPCTAGSKILENYKATYDATVIKKLKNAGAIFLGKTNMDEFAMGSSTETSYFGPTRNPWDFTRVPGGSSGGSAAAVASNLCLAALGSDTGGSIRQPASFCGVYGLKPTYGRVSRYGLIAMASSLDQIGPLTRSIDDLAIVLQTIEGKDEFDSTTYELMFKTEIPKKSDLKKFKIGLPKEYFSKDLDKKIKEKIDQVVKKLEENKAEIKEINLPHTEYALACYYIIMPAEVSSNLARYDGIRYGYSEEKSKDLLDLYLKSRTKGFGEEVKRRIILGTYILSAGYWDEYYLKAQKVRTLIKKDFEQAFKEVDCLVTPTTPTPAFKIGEKIDDPLTMYLSDIFTVPVNLAGLPALSMPIGKIENLPVGLQIIGNYFEENKILEIGKIIEELIK